MENLPTANKTENSEEEIETEKSILTWNGALSHSTVNDPLVELFFKSVRGMSCEDYRSITVKKSKKGKKEKKRSESSSGRSIESYFDAAWAVDPLRTLKFVFYLRDCRGGKGERQLFRALIRHMCSTECGFISHVGANMEHVPTFGSWKDISICFFGTPLEETAVKLIANQLSRDIKAEHPSLCAKYAPSEGGAVDKAHSASKKIATELGVNLTRYRKKYLAGLRSKLKVIEPQMCAKLWGEIKYEHVPSIANSHYKKAFARHDEQRYTEYLKSVQRGEKKMNASVLMPYQIVGGYLKSDSRVTTPDETVEAQWVSFMKDRRAKWSQMTELIPGGLNVLPLIDVSISMYNSKEPQSVSVAVSLGMTFSLLNSSPQYRGKFITFHTEPQLLTIQGDTLMDQVNSVKCAPWGGSTDLQKSFDLILKIATTFNVPKEEMPQILLILSDMQFNQADNNKTNWDAIECKYADAGYERPTIIFWNVTGGSVDYPVPDKSTPKCALLSGFNDAIMYSLLDGTLPDPRTIVLKALDKERYDVIKLAQ